MAESPPADQRVLAVLRASGVFGSLQEDVLQDLGRFLHLHTIPGGDIVYREGDAADTMFFLISGRLRVSRRDSQGKLLLFNEIQPGQSVGEAGLILQQPRAEDFVVGTGVVHTLADLCRVAYAHVGCDWHAHVVSDPALVRPLETGRTVADPRRAREQLGWVPAIDFETMVRGMVDAQVARLRSAPATHPD